MNLAMLTEKKELVSGVLLVLAGLAVALTLVKVTGFFVTSARAESAVRDAIRHSKPDAQNMTVQLDKAKQVADALKSKNLFAPPGPRQNPITRVMGIFGDEALINGRWYRAGDSVGDARILAVNPTSVETEWDGKKQTFSPIDSGASGAGGPSRPTRSKGSRRSVSVSAGGRPQMVVTQSAAGKKPKKFDKGENPAIKKASQTYKKMSDAQRALFKRVMKERAGQYKRMDDEEKAHFKARIIERISHSGKR